MYSKTCLCSIYTKTSLCIELRTKMFSINCITLVIFIQFALNLSLDVDVYGKSEILSRKKRYVSFPEGSSFSCAICMTIGVIGQPAPTTVPGTFTFGLNWGIAYELPNTTETVNIYRKNKLYKAAAKRRNRRELYKKIEAMLDSAGYNGRQCILKTLCETTQRIVPHGGNMIEEMFRTLFTLPLSIVLPDEPPEHLIYDAAHRLGVLLDSCDDFKCPLSLVDWAKGYYNAPSPKTDITTHPWALASSTFGQMTH